MSRVGNERMGNRLLVLPVAAGTVVKECTMVALNESGYAEEASAKEGIQVVGCAMNYVDNTSGQDGENVVQVARSTFVWENDGTIKGTDLLKDCYIKDAQTVTLTADGSSVAGRILAVENDGVIVDMTQN